MLSNNFSVSAGSELTSMDCLFVCPSPGFPSLLPWASLKHRKRMVSIHLVTGGGKGGPETVRQLEV